RPPRSAKRSARDENPPPPAQVDFKAGTGRLDPGTTKNLEGRVFVMRAELRAMLEAQRTVTETKQQRTGSIIPCVFHRTKRGRPLKRFRKAWQQRVRRLASQDASCTTSDGRR